MTLAPSRPLPTVASAPPSARAASIAECTVDVTEVVTLAARLDRSAAALGDSVSPMSIVAKAFIVASLHHPTVDARWPLLPDRHGLRLSELTAALEGADAASRIPDDAAVLSVSSIVRQPTGIDDRIELRDTVVLRLAFDPRCVDAVEAQKLLADTAAFLTDPWELVAHC